MTNQGIAKQVIERNLLAEANEKIFKPAGFSLVARANVIFGEESVEEVEEIYFITSPIQPDTQP